MSARSAPTSTPVPVPPGPFAVVVTNSGRTGATYAVMLINDDAQIVASTTAKLPAVRPHQTLSLPLVSVSDSTVYFLNGNTNIDSLSPSGTTGQVMTIPEGATEEVAFAVSPDDQRIAVTEITEAPDFTDDTSQAYLEDLPSGADRVSLWGKVTGTAALRWPAGWDGASVIDEAWAQFAYAVCGPPNCGGYSYQVVAPATRDVTATVCRTPPSQPAYETPNATVISYAMQGLPTPAGIACFETAVSYGPTGGATLATTIVDTLEAVAWSGTPTTFAQVNPDTDQQWSILPSCVLSPDGSRMACTSPSNGALMLLSSGGTMTNSGHQYAGILGWIDATHLLVDVDSGNLGVLVTVAVPQASQVEMVGTLPGEL